MDQETTVKTYSEVQGPNHGECSSSDIVSDSFSFPVRGEDAVITAGVYWESLQASYVVIATWRLRDFGELRLPSPSLPVKES